MSVTSTLPCPSESMPASQSSDVAPQYAEPSHTQRMHRQGQGDEGRKHLRQGRCATPAVEAVRRARARVMMNGCSRIAGARSKCFYEYAVIVH